MAMVMLVAAAEAGEPTVGPAAVAGLASLGITRVALLRHGSSTGVVLEGWAFDPSRSDEAARALFPIGTPSVRTFHEIEDVGVSAPAHSGRS